MQRRSEPLRVAIFLLLACLALPSAASGASSEEAPQPARERRYVFGYLGALDAEADANALGDPGTSFAFGLGGGYRRRPSLGLEVDVTFNVRTYDVPEDTPDPLFGTIDKLTLTSALSFFNVKATYPGKRVEPFVGGGVLKRVIALLRAGFAKATIRGRLDAGFASPEIFDYLDAEGVEYAVAMPKNSILERRAKRALGRASRLSRESGQTERVYAETSTSRCRSPGDDRDGTTLVDEPR